MMPVMDRHLPEVVTRAQATATASSFSASCDPAVGRFLAALAAGLPPDARVLEVGTGTGVGTSWLVAGLSGRSDVTVDTIDLMRTGRGQPKAWAGRGGSGSTRAMPSLLSRPSVPSSSSSPMPKVASGKGSTARSTRLHRPVPWWSMTWRLGVGSRIGTRGRLRTYGKRFSPTHASSRPNFPSRPASSFRSGCAHRQRSDQPDDDLPHSFGNGPELRITLPVRGCQLENLRRAEREETPIWHRSLVGRYLVYADSVPLGLAVE